MSFPDVVNVIRNPSELRKFFVPDPVLIGDVEVDVLSVERKELTWEVTERSVESGFDMATARKKRPVSLRIEGWLTDSPLSPSAIGTSLIAGEGFSFKTWKDKKDELETAADDDELKDITTRLDVYVNMSITLLAVEHTKDSSGGYPFVLEARNLNIYQSQITSIDPSQIPKNLRDKELEKHKKGSGKKKPTENKGQKVTEKATSKDEDPLRLLARGLGFGV
jgi:hypothetical protein